MKKFLIGMLVIGTSISVAVLIGLLYHFITILQTLGGG